MADDLPGSDPSGLGEAGAHKATAGVGGSGDEGRSIDGRINDLERRVKVWTSLQKVLSDTQRVIGNFDRAMDAVERRIKKAADEAERLKGALEGASGEGGSAIGAAEGAAVRVAKPPSARTGAALGGGATFAASPTGQVTQLGGGSTFSGQSIADRAESAAITSTERGQRAQTAERVHSGSSRTGLPQPVAEAGNGGGWTVGRVAATVGLLGIGAAATYVARTQDLVAQSDYALQQISFSSGMGGRGREQIRRGFIDAGGAAGTLGYEDYLGGQAALRQQGLLTQQALTAGLQQAAGLASVTPGLGTTGGVGLRGEIFTPQTLNRHMAITGQVINPLSTDPNEIANFFRDRARAAQITNTEQLGQALLPGTERHTYLEDLSPTARQAFSEFTTADMRARAAGETLNLNDPRQLERLGVTGNLLSTNLRENEAGVRLQTAAEQGVINSLDALSRGAIRTKNEMADYALAHEEGTRQVTGFIGTLGGLVERLSSSLLGPAASGGLAAVGAYLGSKVGGVRAVAGRVAGGVAGGATSVARVGLGGVGGLIGGWLGAGLVGRHTRDRSAPVQRGGETVAGGLRGAGTGAIAGLPGVVIGGVAGTIWGGRPTPGEGESWWDALTDTTIGDPYTGHGRGGSTTGMDPRMSSALEAMLRDNPRLRINSGHRSSDEQAALHASGDSPAGPGESFHERGVAADVGPSSEYGWLRLNASRYGLEHITQSEPWHVELRGSRGPYEKHASIANEMRSRMGGTDDMEGVYLGADLGSTGHTRPGESGLKPHVKLARRFIQAMWGVDNIGGVGARKNASDHPRGLALDAMVAQGEAATGPAKTKGDSIAQWFDRNAQAFGTKYTIWWQKIASPPGSGWRQMEDRGSDTANHLDHPHLSFKDSHAVDPSQLPVSIDMAGIVDPGGATDPNASDDNTSGVTFAPRFGDLYGQISQRDLIQTLLSGGGSVAGTSTRNKSSTGSGVATNLATGGDIPSIILRVGQALGATPQMLLAAMQTGLVESEMRTGEAVAYKDHDSIGVMQQRAPWASEPNNIPWQQSKRNDPSWAANAFFMGGEGGQPGAFQEARRGHRTAGELAQDVQVSRYPHKYNARREEAVALAAQYGVDLSGVSDPYPAAIVDIPAFRSGGGGRDTAGTMAGPVGAALLGGGGTTRHYGATGEGGTVIQNLTMHVTLANGSRAEVDRLMDEIDQRAHQSRLLTSLGGGN